VVLVLRLEVKRCDGPQLLTDDLERVVVRIAVAHHQLEGMHVACVGIVRGQQAHDGTRRGILRNDIGRQEHFGRRLVVADHQDHQRRLDAQPAQIRGPHAELIFALRREVQHPDRPQFLADDLEGPVVHVALAHYQLERVGVVGVRVQGRQQSDDRTRRSILCHRGRSQDHVGRRFVDVRHLDDQRRFHAQAAQVGGPHADVVLVLRLEVQRPDRPQFLADDHEGPVVRVALARHELERVRIAHVRIGRRQLADHRARGRIFRNIRGRQEHFGRRFVDVDDLDCQGSFDAQTGSIGGPHADLVVALRVDIQRHDRLQLLAVDRKGSVVRIAVPRNECKGVGIVHVGIHGGQDADDGTGDCVFRNAVRREDDILRSDVVRQGGDVWRGQIHHPPQQVAGIQGTERPVAGDVADDSRIDGGVQDSRGARGPGVWRIDGKAAVQTDTNSGEQTCVLRVVPQVSIGIAHKHDGVQSVVGRRRQLARIDV